MTEAPRPLYWSVRRELWENRAVTVAPPAVAAAFLFGYLVSTIRLPERMHEALALDAAKRSDAVAQPYNLAAGLMMLTAFVVGVFYCLDALHGERRDRSILFWKSLPVPDWAAVLAKASIPMLVLPPFTFVLALATRLLVLLMSSVRLAGDEPALAALWTNAIPFESSVALLYAVAILALWHAPLYAWLLLVSSWARRAAFLWAVLPPLLLTMFEKMAFGTHYVYLVLGGRMTGWLTNGFDMRAPQPVHPLAAMTPGRFFSAPGLWLGLVFAAAFLTVAVQLRRNREPI